MARLLTPVSYLYRFGGMIRAALARPAENAAPVLCIGNAITGGAGKTPLTLALANMLQRRDCHLACVSRGYGGNYKGAILVDEDTHDASAVGDEPLLLAARMPVFLCRKRPYALAAAAAIDPDMILVDDGMQNPSFTKDILILAENPEYPPENTRIFPSGPYREPEHKAQARADIIARIYYREQPEQAISEMKDGTPVFSFYMQPDTGEHDLDFPYIAFAGIGNPEKFFATLRGNGFNITDTFSFPDHYAYTEADCDDLLTHAEHSGALLITTEKDRVRLPLAMRVRVRYLNARLTLPDDAEQQLVHLIFKKISRRAPSLQMLYTDH